MNSILLGMKRNTLFKDIGMSFENGGSKRTKISGCGAYSSSSNPKMPIGEDVGVESLVRRQGTKASKRKGKVKSKASTSFDEDIDAHKSITAKKLSPHGGFKKVKEMESVDKEKDRAFKERLMMIKEKELEEKVKERTIKAKEQEVKERETNMQILYADTSTMSETQ